MSAIEELMELQEAVTPQVLEELAGHAVLKLEEQQSIQQRCLQKVAMLQERKAADGRENRNRAAAINEEEGYGQADPHNKFRERYHGKKLKKWVSIVAICALLFSLSTTAIGTLTTDKRLLQLFQADSQSQIAQLNEMSYQINQSVTDNGYTITVQEAIYDAHHIWVLLELEGPEDSQLNADQIYFKKTDIQLERMGGFGYTTLPLPDDNPNDNRVSLVLELSAQERISTQKITILLEDIGEYSYDLGQEGSSESDGVMITEGTWQFTFQLPDSESTVSMWQWKILQDNDKPFLLRKIEVSPLSITLDTNRLQWDTYANLDDAPIQVFLKDGSALVLSCGSSGGSGFNMQFNYNFTVPIDLNSIDSILYCGRELNW